MQTGDANITVVSNGAAVSNNGPTRVSRFSFPTASRLGGQRMQIPPIALRLF